MGYFAGYLTGRAQVRGGIRSGMVQCDKTNQSNSVRMEPSAGDPMRTPLLATKFHIQLVRPKSVRRHGLVDRLSAGLGRKLTLVSAPAGFGKSTLVGEWVQELQAAPPTTDDGGERPHDSCRVAWLSLDENDNDYARFFTYLIGALQSIETTGTAGKNSPGTRRSPLHRERDDPRSTHLSG
jgi:ATP/maltotriose-dependent transcriptional regulator MalT